MGPGIIHTSTGGQAASGTRHPGFEVLGYHVFMSEPIFQKLDACQGFPYTRGEYVRRYAWRLVEATLFRFSLGRAYRWRRFLLKMFGAKLAATSRVRPGARVFHPWLLEMGEHSIIADKVKVYNLGIITIGDHTTVSQGVHLCAGTHDYQDPTLPLQRPPIEIGSGVWVCVDSFVGPGVKVGDNAVVGARSVVVGDVEAGMVVGGNPAKVIKKRLG